MILTIQQGADSYQLKAPVFELERDEWCLLVDDGTVSLTGMEEYRPDDPDYGYLVLGSTATVVEDRVTVDVITECDMPKSLRKIKTINGVVPNDQGDFFIDGSDCDSWQYGTEVEEERDGVVTRSWVDDGHTISLMDLCPACTSCETIYRLKYEVENLKMWLNTLKDVSLYWSRIYDDRQDHVGQRRSLLNSLRITGGTLATSCGEGFTEDDRYMQLKGIQLLQQYMTVVHMWNYVVSRNNSSTLITIAPEDTTGFVVQTKRALTSCADKQGIRCCIDVKPLGIIKDGTVDLIEGGYPANYPISVYVPDRSNEFSFEPFMDDRQDLVLGDVHSMTIRTLGDALAQPVAHKQADTSATGTTYIDARVAGTYVATVKFLPFIYYRTWRGYLPNGQPNYISMRNGKNNADVKPYPVGEDGTVVYNFGITDCRPYSVSDPTETNYLDAKTGPTCSVAFKILWDISITWAVLEKSSNEPKEETENYKYLANGIRMYFRDASVMSDTTVLPLEPDEPEQTGE